MPSFVRGALVRRGPGSLLLVVVAALASGCERYEPEVSNEIDGLYANCCDGVGLCLPSALVEAEDAARLTQDRCGEDLLCVPEAAAMDDDYVPLACRAYGYIEGRCLPACLPEVASEGDRLTEAGCPSGHRCAPCYDPVTGENTDACRVGDDPGPADPPRVFERCCEGRSRCVPSELIPERDRGQLSPDDCPATGQLCVPDPWVSSDTVLPADCRTPGGGEGRCLSECLSDVAARADGLRQATCLAGELCVPCFDPLSGEDTGACRVGEDPGPREPARLFGRCCADEGRCVPGELVPVEHREHLTADACEEPDALCVPQPWLDAEVVIPASCTAAGGGEGRCLPDCLPVIAQSSERLTADTCADGSLCAPCFDPLTGEETGACAIGDDPGPSRPASVFSRCCDGLGRCVPESEVATADRSELGRDSCAAADALCVPEMWLESDSIVPASCRAVGDFEGRCLPACLPDVESERDRLEPGSCTDGQLCVPCFDPLTGTGTGACGVGDDTGPTEPVRTFSFCCGGHGRCVPRSTVGDADADDLGADTCAGEDDLCVPDAWLADDGFVPASCEAIGDAEGRCLPRCLPDVSAQAARLSQASCAEHEACVPCYDPVSGDATGACELAGDTGPTAPPSVFEACCDGAGQCVPSELVDADDAAQLVPDQCVAPDALCVPSRWLRQGEPGEAPVDSCRAWNDAEGRCLPECLPAVSEVADQLRRDTCLAAHVCAPCYDPITGEASGACELAGDSGPQEPVKTFDGCCEVAGEELGLCIPDVLAPTDQVDALQRDTCAGADQRCVPNELRDAPGAPRPACEVSGLLSTEPGGCVPACVLGGLESLVLDQEDCAEGYLCAPCEELESAGLACSPL